MVRSKLFYFDLNCQFSYVTYKFIYQFSSFKFNCNSILWWVETNFAVKIRSITIVLALSHPLIHHINGLLADQPFLRWIVVSPQGITFVISIQICIYLNTNPLLLILLIFLRMYRVLASTSIFVFILYYLFPQSLASFYSVHFFDNLDPSC